jgi:hypothetical protein
VKDEYSENKSGKITTNAITTKDGTIMNSGNLLTFVIDRSCRHCV